MGEGGERRHREAQRGQAGKVFYSFKGSGRGGPDDGVYIANKGSLPQRRPSDHQHSSRPDAQGEGKNECDKVKVSNAAGRFSLK